MIVTEERLIYGDICVNFQFTLNFSAVFVGCRQEFVVNAQTASRTPSVPAGDRVKALLAPPQTKNVIPLDVVDRHDGTYSVSFVPHHEGAHHIAVYYENLEVTPKTTYAVYGADAGRVKAFGPGLNYGVVDRQCEFQVDTKNAGQGGLGIQITGPSEAVTQIQDNTDGSCTVQYNPTEPGVYEIGVKFADVDIPGSPFRAIVDYEVDARKVVASGPGLDSNQVREGVPVSFEVDATRSGLAPLDVTLKADRGPQLAPPQIYELNNKVYRVTYMPLTADANVDINITYDERQISASPIRVRVQPVFEPEKVKLTSEDGGALSDVPASLPVRLLVDATKAGDADLQVVVTGPEGEPRLVKVVDSGNNTYEVNFIPDDPGRYEVLVRYGGQTIARQPHSFKAYPVGDASKCWIVEKPSEPVAAGEEHCVTVNTANAGKGRLTARMQPVRGGTQPLDVEVGDNGDGTFTVYFTPILAEPHAIRLMYGGRDIPDGAWTMQVDLAERIKAERLTSGAANGDVSKSHPVAFWNFNFEDIDIRKLKATVMMPNKKMDAPSIVENHDGTVTVKYQPKVQGTHILEIKHDQSHVQGEQAIFAHAPRC
uniref:Filamin/ABP280 repeat protein n=1 Tax=Plectus sambesii TaxID=2011161 RepID=A0A914XHJ2_9BILA